MAAIGFVKLIAFVEGFCFWTFNVLIRGSLYALCRLEVIRSFLSALIKLLMVTISWRLKMLDVIFIVLYLRAEGLLLSSLCLRSAARARMDRIANPTTLRDVSRILQMRWEVCSSSTALHTHIAGQGVQGCQAGSQHCCHCCDGELRLCFITLTLPLFV